MLRKQFSYYYYYYYYYYFIIYSQSTLNLSIMAPKKNGRGMTFQTCELNTLLTLLEEKLPIGGDQWDTVMLEYNRNVPKERARDVDSLRTKFKGLKNKKKPTGDPDCPEEVRRAKRIDYAMQQRIGVEDFDDDADNDDLEEPEQNAAEFEEAFQEEEMEEFLRDDAVNRATAAALIMSSAENENVQQPPTSSSSSDSTIATPLSSGNREGRSTTPAPRSAAGTLRTGQTASELRALSRSSRNSTPSPTATNSTTSTTRRTIDNVLNEFITPANNGAGDWSFAQMMMWQRQEESNKEKAREAIEKAREERERERALEQERYRREDIRLQQEREDRREESNRQFMMLLLKQKE
jgi:hypothetical protein